MASYAFHVRGIEPRDPAWHLAGETTRRAFWRAVVDAVLVEKDRELAAGLDRFGRKMIRIAASTRAKGRWRSHTGMGSADAPPLDPAYAISRTRSLFTGRALVDHAEFFWRVDDVTGMHWGRILGYHRDGAGRLPVRDVIGLSPGSLARVKKAADAWWADWKAGRIAAHLAGTMKLAAPVTAPSGRPVASRPNLAPAGRIDLHNFTFGIGGSKQQVEQAVAEGSFTGFRQLKPRPRAGGGGTAAKPPARPPAALKPPGRAAASPARPDLSRKPPRPQIGTSAGKRADEAAGVEAARFAVHVGKAAEAIPAEKLFGGDKAFIHHVYSLYKAAAGNPELSFEEFKRRLIDARRRGKLELSRADMVEAMNPTSVRLSNTELIVNGVRAALFNFIRVKR